MILKNKKQKQTRELPKKEWRVAARQTLKWTDTKVTSLGEKLRIVMFVLKPIPETVTWNQWYSGRSQPYWIIIGADVYSVSKAQHFFWSCASGESREDEQYWDYNLTEMETCSHSGVFDLFFPWKTSECAKSNKLIVEQK